MGSLEPKVSEAAKTQGVSGWPSLILFWRSFSQDLRIPMKSAFEKVRIEARSSIALLDRRLRGGIPFEWHHHPEFELTLTLNSRGHRFTGDHLGPYEDGDLVLVGPNLPHTWCSSSAIDPSRPHVALVSWFSDAWARDVMRLMPELAGIEHLLREARRGVLFSRAVSQEVRPQIES